MGESPISVRAALESARFLAPTGTADVPADLVAGVSRNSAEANRLVKLLLTLLIGVFWGGRAYNALYAYATLRSGNSKAGFVTAVAICALAAPSFSLRPQMLGYVSIILMLIALERFRQGKTGLMVSSTAMELPVLLVLVMGMIRIVQADKVQFDLDYRGRVALLFHNIPLRPHCPRATWLNRIDYSPRETERR